MLGGLIGGYREVSTMSLSWWIGGVNRTLIMVVDWAGENLNSVRAVNK
jgi:hypothetical protein